MAEKSFGRTASAVRLLLLAAVGALGLASAAAQQPAFTPRDEEPEEFPDAPGREEAFYGCTACHGFKLVAAQGMSRGRWEETIDLMVERHGMPKPDAKEREIILDYLVRAFPERTPAQRGRQNPFLKR
jgi:mono/diheme cytochrome c family protein